VHKLPPAAQCLAQNFYEPHHAYRIGDFSWGVQFHPEYDSVIMRAYIVEQAREMSLTDEQTAALLRSVSETPMAARVLRNFVQIVDSVSKMS
jgi:GMP synthase (glutamine-hydrolysing)